MELETQSASVVSVNHQETAPQPVIKKLPSINHKKKLTPQSVIKKLSSQLGPRRSDSVPSPYLAGNHVSLFGNLFRLTSAFRGLSFSFVAYGSDLLVKVWFVFIVLSLEVTPRITSVLHVFSSTIHGKTDKCLQDISHFFLQLVSQDSEQELFRHTISLYLDVLRIEFQFCCLRTRFVSQGVFCFHCFGFGGFLGFYGDFPQRFSWFHPICFLVYIICLGDT